MANEITAEELAASVAGPECDYNAKTLIFAERFLAFSRALASLQAERATDAPERVRCWKAQDGVITDKQSDADFWREVGIPVTPGWFTPDTKGSTE